MYAGTPASPETVPSLPRKSVSSWKELGLAPVTLRTTSVLGGGVLPPGPFSPRYFSSVSFAAGSSLSAKRVITAFSSAFSAFDTPPQSFVESISFWASSAVSLPWLVMNCCSRRFRLVTVMCVLPRGILPLRQPAFQPKGLILQSSKSASAPPEVPKRFTRG